MKKLLRCLVVLLLIACLAIPASALTVDQALELLDKYYVDEIPDAARQATTLDELFERLGDPYSYYMSAEEYRDFIDGINTTAYVGIGVTIEDAEDGRGVLVSSVVDGSPAQEAGLAVGDVILTADGTALTDTAQARNVMRGLPGQTVALTVHRASGETVTLTLTLKEIHVRVTTTGGLALDGTACVIQCKSFGETTPQEFVDLIDQYGEYANVWIIDLSQNLGGTSQSGAGAAGCFAGDGIMIFLRDGEGYYTYTYVMPGTPRRTERPAILMTGPYTASSAEMFTAAIRDYGAGIALGQRTYGKGVAQNIFDADSHPELFDGDGLKITVYRFFSPGGVTNDQIGVFPTLLTALDKTYGASLLLRSVQPEDPKGYLSIDLAGWEFFLKLDEALSEDFRASFVELLESLPPYAGVWKDGGAGRWKQTTVADVAEQYGLKEYKKRTFADLDGCAQADAVDTLRAFELVSGYGDGTFRPEALVTRAEFCAMLGSVLGLDLPPVKESSFTDVPTGAWYAPVVHAMASSGLVAGYEDGTFRPEETVTQEEVVGILAAAAEWLNMNIYDLRYETPPEDDLAPYAAFSRWAQRSAWELGLLGMDLGDVAPQAATTRAQAAELLCDLLAQAGILWK